MRSVDQKQMFIFRPGQALRQLWLVRQNISLRFAGAVGVLKF
jgi:hypothetical protein